MKFRLPEYFSACKNSGILVVCGSEQGFWRIYPDDVIVMLSDLSGIGLEEDKPAFHNEGVKLDMTEQSKRDGQRVPTSSLCTKVTPKYPGYRGYHLMLLTSFGTTVWAVEDGSRAMASNSRPYTFQPNGEQGYAVNHHLHSVFIASNNSVKLNWAETLWHTSVW